MIIKIIENNSNIKTFYGRIRGIFKDKMPKNFPLQKGDLIISFKKGFFGSETIVYINPKCIFDYKGEAIAYLCENKFVKEEKEEWN